MLAPGPPVHGFERKSTLEIPDEIFRKAKANAAICGIPFRQIVTEALEEKIESKPHDNLIETSPPWMRGFGALSFLHEENTRIDFLIREEFGSLEAEDFE